MTNLILNMATVGDNSAVMLADLDKQMAKLGAESVNVARPKLAIALVQAAADGTIDEDDVEARYDAYLAGRERAQSKSLLAAGVDDGNGKKANVSKCTQLVRMAMLPNIDGPTLIDRTATLRGNMLGGDEKIEAPFDAFVKVARAQIAKPDAMLTEDEIAVCIRKTPAKDKDEIAKLIEDYKRMHKRAAEMPNLPSLAEAVTCIGDAIVELGGEIPPMTKEEKEMAAFMSKAKSMGFSFAGATVAAE